MRSLRRERWPRRKKGTKATGKQVRSGPCSVAGHEGAGGSRSCLAQPSGAFGEEVHASPQRQRSGLRQPGSCRKQSTSSLSATRFLKLKRCSGTSMHRCRPGRALRATEPRQTVPDESQRWQQGISAGPPLFRPCSKACPGRGYRMGWLRRSGRYGRAYGSAGLSGPYPAFRDLAGGWEIVNDLARNGLECGSERDRPLNLHTVEVTGSNPVSPTLLRSANLLSFAELRRASPTHKPRGSTSPGIGLRVCRGCGLRMCRGRGLRVCRGCGLRICRWRGLPVGL